jgi:hypothetical protein
LVLQTVLLPLYKYWNRAAASLSPSLFSIRYYKNNSSWTAWPCVTRILQNVGNHSHCGRVSHPRGFEFSATPLQEFHISHICHMFLTKITKVCVLVLYIFPWNCKSSHTRLCTNQLTSSEMLVLEFGSGSVGQSWTDVLCY